MLKLNTKYIAGLIGAIERVRSDLLLKIEYITYFETHTHSHSDAKWLKNWGQIQNVSLPVQCRIALLRIHFLGQRLWLSMWYENKNYGDFLFLFLIVMWQAMAIKMIFHIWLWEKCIENKTFINPSKSHINAS